MTPKKLVQELCKREGLKKQIDVAQVTELVGHLADILYADLHNDGHAFDELLALGERRAEKKARKKS